MIAVHASCAHVRPPCILPHSRGAACPQLKARSKIAFMQSLAIELSFIVTVGGWGSELFCAGTHHEFLVLASRVNQPSVVSCATFCH